jgi:hypothetical protein
MFFSIPSEVICAAKAYAEAGHVSPLEYEREEDRFAAMDHLCRAKDFLVKQLVSFGQSVFVRVSFGTVVVHPSSKQRGYWQVTRLDVSDIPLSDTLHSSLEGGMRELVNEVSADEWDRFVLDRENESGIRAA